MNFDLVIFCNRLQTLRNSRNMSQLQVATALNISVQYVSNMENAQRSPSIDLLIVMADLFRVSLDFLILGTENNVDYQKKMAVELAQSLEHLEKVDLLLKQLK